MKRTGYEVKAIPCTYAGVEFKSRAEGRWAVFFDHLGIPWQYEPEGYQLESGWYLPDFWLPDQACFMEVKGARSQLSEAGEQMLRELAIVTGFHVYLSYGPMEARAGVYGQGEYNEKFWGGVGGWDNYHEWCICNRCHRLGLEYMGRSERLCGCFSDDAKRYTDAHPRILAAYDAARCHSFWQPAPSARSAAVKVG